MRKNRLKSLGIVTAAVMMMGTNAWAEEAKEYDYPEKYLWYEDATFPGNDAANTYEHHTAMGQGEGRDGRGWDIDVYVNSELGEGTIQNLMPYILYGEDASSEESIAYWESLGVKKEVFDADDEERIWSIFTPLSMEEENVEKVYPVIFNFHGKNNPIQLAETYGYVEMIPEEEFIVICPWGANGDGQHDDPANGVTMMEEVERIWNYVKENYPVDESRVYASGFSGGGRATQVAAYTFTSMFAAIAPSPQFFDTDGAEDQWEALEEVGMPIVCISGEYDRYMPVRTEDQIANVQHWLKVNGVEEQDITLENIILRTSYADQAIASTGLPFENTYIEQMDGTDWYIGEFFNEEGLCVVRVAVVEGMPHWPSGSWAEYNWEFLKQWSRDVETGESIYTE